MSDNHGQKKSAPWLKRWGLLLTLLWIVAGLPIDAAPASDVVGLSKPSHDTPPEYPMRFAHLSIEDGLSHGMVLRIAQDNLGFMWFGTADGLNRYDSHTFKVYKARPNDPGSLRSDSIWALYVDRTGTVWVGTEGGGLQYLDRDTDSFVHYLHDPDNPHSLSADGVTVVYEDQAGTLWVGTATGGLNRFDRKTEQFTRYQFDPDNSQSLSHNGIICLFEDSRGTLWVGTADGLNRFDREAGSFTRYQNDPENPHSLNQNSVWAIQEAGDGDLWIGTGGGGLNRFDHETEQFTHYQFDADDPNSLSNDIVFALHVLPDGMLLVGTYGGGLNRLDPQTSRFTRYENDDLDSYGLSSNHIRTIYADRSGVLWIGTESGGVNRYDPVYKNFQHYRAIPENANSLSHNFVTTLYEDQDEALWIGTLDGGLNRLDHETGTFTHYRHDPDDPDSLSDDNVTGIYRDHLGELWVATADNGLNRLESASGGFVHYRHDPNDPDSLSCDALYTLFEDSAGQLWIGTNGGGLELFDRESGRFVHYRYEPNDPGSLSHDRINIVYEDRAGTLWIGTAGGGVNRFDRETERFTRYQADANNPNSLSNEVVYAIYEDQAGNLWFGTAGGLSQFDPATQTFNRYGENEGLPNDMICGILGDEAGHVWLSTARGIARLDPQTGAVKSYDAGDGLQSTQFQPGSYYRGQGGTLFFGGVNGFNAFRPEEIQDNPVTPPVVLTALYQGQEFLPLDRAVETVEEITLRWPNNFFEFEFAALNYVHPEKNQYTYILEGFDRDWNDIGNRHCGRYTNLPGGTYTLRLKGTNNDGVWNEEGRTLLVTIVPPIWSSWWFRILGGALLVGGVGAGLILKVRSVERKRAEEVLRESEEKLSAAFASSPVGVGIVTLDGTYAEVNAALCEMTGYSHDELIGKTLVELELISAVKRTHILETLDRAGGTLRNFETHFRARDGNVHDILLSMHPITLNNIPHRLSTAIDITERKQAVEALQQERQRLRDVIEGTNVGTWEWNVQTGETIVNARWAELIGHTLDDLAPITLETWTQRTHPDDLSIAENLLKRHFAGELPYYECECRMKHRDGHWIWVLDRGKVTSWTADGKPLWMYGTHQDITARKYAEEQIRESQLHLEQTVQTLRDRERFLSALHDITQASLESTELKEMLQILADRLGELFFADGCYLNLWDEEIRTLVRGAAYGDWQKHYYEVEFDPDEPTVTAAVLQSGQPIPVEDIYDTPYLSRHPAELSPNRSLLGLPLIANEQKLGAVLIAYNEPHHFTDLEITRGEQVAQQIALAIAKARLYQKLQTYAGQLEARVQARTVELQAQYAELDAILRSVGDTILMTDAQQRVRYVNPTFTASTGYPEADVLGQKIYMLEALEKFAPRLRALLPTLQPAADTTKMPCQRWQGEAVTRRQDGRVYETAWTITPLHDEAGDVTGHVFTHRDISQAKKLEHARAQFIANVSQQFRTPLTSLKTGVYLLQHATLTERQQQQVQRIATAINWLIQLLQDIETVVALDSGKGVEVWKPVFLPDIVADTLVACERRAQAAGVTLSATPMPDLSPITGDPARLTQALRELVENAIVFTPAGGQITLVVETPEPEWVTVTVRDTGPGIPSEELPRLFERFFRGQQIVEEGHLPGTGLGLSIAQQIIEAHGGRVTVESTAGKGSAFTLWLRA